MPVPINNLIYTVGALLEKEGNAVFRPFGLTVKTYALLAHLAEGDSTNSELARLNLGSASAVAQKARFLEAKGYITRTADDQDGRVWRYSLTPQGGQALDAILPAYRAAIAPLYQGIDESDVATATRVLTELKDRLSQ